MVEHMRRFIGLQTDKVEDYFTSCKQCLHHKLTFSVDIQANENSKDNRIPGNRGPLTPA